jgi:signal transduction histidine kinase
LPLREQLESTTMQGSEEMHGTEGVVGQETSSSGRAGYLAYVAHEMRNPLSTALWSAELLARLSPEDRAGPRGEKLAGMCLRTLARLRHLVEDHFLTERLAIHGLPVRLEAVPLADAIAAAAGRATGARCDIDVDGVVVAADRALLERAVEGLVAVAARENTPVRVSAETRGELVEVRIQGATPPPDAFRMPDRSTPSDASGRPLSVLMARSVARVHGGDLALVDDGFALTLPVEDASAGAGGE